MTYYGGKQKLAGQLVALMPAHQLYLEPFAGGAAVLFRKPRCPRETINDIDGAVVAFWRVLRDNPDELARLVAEVETHLTDGALARTTYKTYMRFKCALGAPRRS